MKTLFLFVEDQNLLNLYKESVELHNPSVENNMYADSGFDLFLPQDFYLEKGIQFISHGVKAAMYETSENHNGPSAFCIYSRSSIYKTPLRMTNSVGIIDRGYRGNLGSVFDVLENNVILTQGQRLVQICSPDLVPFKVKLVYDAEELGRTERGEQGFGSTGK